MSKYLIEFIGTFFLVLIIALTGDPLAIGFGLTALVYMGGAISGAHYNPAVTFAVWLIGKLDSFTAVIYIFTQLLAGFTASMLYFYLQKTLFLPLVPEVTPIGMAMIVELIFTFFLVSVVLNTAISEKTKGNDYFGLAIGLTVMTGALSVGTISGAVFNPAVAVGPMLFNISNLSANMPSLMTYILSPLAGGILASILYKNRNM